MIIGSGLVARAMSGRYATDSRTLVYAAGVSNSGCSDAREFERERERLERTLDAADAYRTVIYFGTVSVTDPDAATTHYVQHKLRMEEIVRRHPGHLVLRLPQLAGNTPNPHTLLNFLYARIVRGERFTLWQRARRNIIDVDDVARVVPLLVADPERRVRTLDVANPRDYAAGDIAAAMERLLGKRAIFDAVDRGGSCRVDVAAILPLFNRAGVRFDDGYLERVLRNYYG